MFNGNSSKTTKILYEEIGQVTRDAVEHIRTVTSLNADRQALFALTNEVLSISSWLNILYEFNPVKPCMESISSILNHDQKIDSSSFTEEIIQNLKGSVEFQNVSFSYSSRPHIQVLNNFCLSIPAGKKMALVAQEPVLFNDTTKAHLTFGLEHGTSEAEITSAATLANAHDFIINLPQGYDTLVGGRGMQLSGGQKQGLP
ncbi:hypothetical protein ACH5RR_016111 [Cinchona calisaya]|uniref:Uncharacterized protein n=1 Tax=Cinchona calisaya TaxID=153742 RepID=A0ABD2ZYN9_9GENT